MARVKRAVNAHKKRREVLDQASGYRGQRSRLYRKAKEQRGGPRRGHDVQPVHRRTESRGRRGRPEDAGRNGSLRPDDVRHARRDGQVASARGRLIDAKPALAGWGW